MRSRDFNANFGRGRNPYFRRPQPFTPAQFRPGIQTSGTGRTGSTGGSSAKFDFTALNKLFLEKGIDALLNELKTLKAAGAVDNFKVKTDASTQKTTVTVEVDGIEYEFIGVAGDNPTTNNPSEVPEAEVQKTINNVISEFAKGNMTYKDAENALKKVGISISTPLTKDTKDSTQSYFEFKYKGVEYCVKCSTEAINDGKGGKTVVTWSQEEIKKQGFTKEQLDKYFQGVAWKQGEDGALFYRAQSDWPKGVSTPAQLKTYLDTPPTTGSDSKPDAEVPPSTEPTTPPTPPEPPVNPAEALRSPIADVADYIVSVCKDAIGGKNSITVNYSIDKDGNIQFSKTSNAIAIFDTIFTKIKSNISRHAAEAFDKFGGEDMLKKLLQAAWIEASAGINTGATTNTSEFINKVMSYIDNILAKTAKDDKYLEYYVNNCYQDQTLIKDLPNIDDTKINTNNVKKYDDGKMHLYDDVSDKKFQATMNRLLERLYNKYPNIDKNTIKELFYKAQENALSFKDRPDRIKAKTSNMNQIVNLVLYHFDKLFKQGARTTVFAERKADAPVAGPKSSQTAEQNKNIKEGASGIMNDVLDVKDFIASNCKNKFNNKNTIHTEFGIDTNGNIVFQDNNTKIVYDEIFKTLESRINRKSPNALKKLGGSAVLKQLLQAAWITTYNSFNSSQSNDIIQFVNKVMDNMESILKKLQTNPELMEVFTKHTSYADKTLTDGLKHYGTKTTYGNDEVIIYEGAEYVHDDGTVHLSNTIDDNDYQTTMAELLQRLIKKYPSVSQDIIRRVFTQAQAQVGRTLQYNVNDCPYGTGNNNSRVEDSKRNWGGRDNRAKDKGRIHMDQLVQITLYYFDKLLMAELMK